MTGLPPLTLTVVLVERPEDYAYEQRDDETGAVTGYTAHPETFGVVGVETGLRMAAALQRLLDAGEGECMCDLKHLVDEASGQMCSNYVGWLLYEDDEHPMGGGLRWHTAALVDNGAVTAVVCEDDSPENLYENAARNRVEVENRDGPAPR